jgi:RNA polymerase sigma-70 factor, ECF subfamily
LVNLQNNTDTFKALFEASFYAHFEPLHRYACTLLRNPEQAQDVVQSTFVKWWEAGTAIQNLEEARKYLYTAVYNTSLNAIRNEKSQKARTEDYKLQLHEAKTPTDALVVEELNNRINVSIDALPTQCKTIFCMSRFEGKTYGTIANELNLSIKTVETQMGKALRILREKLAGYVPAN